MSNPVNHPAVNNHAILAEVGQSNIEKLPAVLIGQIFSHLSLQEWGRACSVSKTMQARLKNSRIQGVWLQSWVFGAKKWAKYFGDVGMEPPLPQNIIEILNSPCPFFEGKKVRDTQMLVLVPKEVGGETLNLNKLGEFIQNPLNKGHATDYKYYNQNVKDAIGDREINQSYWVLMLKDVISVSRNKTFNEQKELVRRYEGIGYTLPGALEAAVCILMEHVVSGNRLFSCEPWTHTLCAEIILDENPVLVGGFSPEGLFISNNYFKYAGFGVAVLQRFF